jgi:hypothetical protein
VIHRDDAKENGEQTWRLKALPIYKRVAPLPGDATNDQKVFASFFKKKRLFLFFFEKNFGLF